MGITRYFDVMIYLLQSKPVAHETRTPNPNWSGLGFSNSMPETVMRGQIGSASSDDSSAAVAAAATTPISTDASSAAVVAAAVNSSKGWFGNSSALDSFIAQSKSSSTSSAPGTTSSMSQPQTALDEVEDDLPSVFAKNVSFLKS